MSLTDTLLTRAPDLAAALEGDEPPVVLDVRWRLNGTPGRDSYLAGHVPGAIFADLDTDLAAPPGAGGRHPLPETVTFQDAMRRSGVSQATPVVVYDDADSVAAARAWWNLRYFGHGRVRVLDGGYRAWTQAGHPVSTEAAAPRLGSFTALPGGMPVLDAAGAAALARSGILLDARSTERYRGEKEPIDPVAGHVPGALCVPTSDNVASDGRFLQPDVLRERFAAFGITGTDAPAVGTYCGSGVTAAHEVLALALTGIRASLYVGSWSSWITDPARPVATGAEPG